MAARCQIELQPPGEVSAFQDPASLLDAVLGEPGLQRDLVRRVLQQHDLPAHLFESDAIDTRVRDDLPVRLIVEGQRVAASFSLPKGSGEDLPGVLDAIFELCFNLSRELDLDVYDPQIDQLVTPSQYERRFQFILDHYTRRHRIAEALGRVDEWERSPESSGDASLLDTVVRAPILSVPREVLPSRRRALRGHFGPLELLGESAHRALEQATSHGYLIALIDAEERRRVGATAQLARIERYTRVAHGVWLAQLQALGLRTIEEREEPSAERGSWVTLSKAQRSK